MIRPKRTIAFVLFATAALLPLPGSGECPEPPLAGPIPGDAAADAAGRGQLLERVSIPGLTDRDGSSTGVALADLNRDGLTDIVAVLRSRRNQREGAYRRMHIFLNRGCMRFEDHPFTITGSDLSASFIGGAAGAPNLADFNGDGFLDILIVRGGPRTPGNTLLVSRGAFDAFEDVSERMGIRMIGAYCRHSAIADVNRDGWLDVAIVSDNIGDTHAGLPLHCLFVFRPSGDRFEDGTFEDVGGTELVPDFGGPYAGDPDVDRAGPQITLRDLDHDGDIDVLHTYHCDMLNAKWDDPKASGTYDYGVYLWRSLLEETGEFRFEREVGNGLAEYGKMRYNTWRERYEPVARAVGHPYVAVADVDNDGLLDVLSVGPTDLEWHVHSDQIAGRFWRNLGGFRFREATSAAGLDALNWTYDRWREFWGADMPAVSENMQRVGRGSNQKKLLEGLTHADRHFYPGDVLFADLDNDGWQDLLSVDRHELSGAYGTLRNVLFMNNGDGTFRPTTAGFSGIDSPSCAAEVADLDSDGLLDLVFIEQPDNSGGLRDAPDFRYRQKVYWNTGAHGARANHWLRVRFKGIPDARLIGAHVTAYEAGTLDTDRARLLGMRAVHSTHSYRSAGPLEAHLGLGAHESVDLEVRLPDGRKLPFTGLKVDRVVELDLAAP
jgi:hypothetical protein